LLDETPVFGTWLNLASKADSVAMVAMLVEEFGFDVNTREDSSGPLIDAAHNGCLNVARWLLEHGAKVDGPGDTSATPLASAATAGSLEVARLLLEHGADPNVLYGTMEYGDPPTNALKQAVMFGHHEVAGLLRSYGAVLPPGCDFGDAPAQAGSLLAHIEHHLGKHRPLSLHEIVPGDPPITIHVVPMANCQALVTTGMSDRAMNVPSGGEDYQFAELVMYLPVDWPLGPKTLADPNHSWPIDWMRRIAHSPHDNRTWLGGRSAVIANGEPPRPLATNTRFTCLLALVEANEFGSFRLPDDRLVVFYTLYPLYTEERDLERQKGTEELLERLQSYEVGRVVDTGRLNVAQERR
jgi:hypothetical protein